MTNEHTPGTTVIMKQYGIGRIITIDTEKIAGLATRLYRIGFESGETKQVPVLSALVRPIATSADVDRALVVLTKKRERQHTPWHRKQTECVAALNKGSIVDVAAVARDLYVTSEKERNSVTELYEQALTLLALEVAHVRNLPRQGVRGALESTIVQRSIDPRLQEKP